MFAPALAVEFTTPTPKTNSAIVATLDIPSGDSALSTAAVTFPPQFTYNERFRPKRCQPAQEAARACPPESKIGRADAISPLGPAAGEIFITQDFRLVAFAEAVGGAIQIKADGAIDVGEGGGFRITFSGLPDLPISQVKLSLVEGDLALLETPEKCGDYVLPGVLTSHEGETATAAPVVTVKGCLPAIGVSRPKATVAGRRATLRWTATPATEATEVRLRRRGKTVANRRVTGTSAVFSKLRPGRYRARLTGVAGERTAPPRTVAFTVAR